MRPSRYFTDQYEGNPLANIRVYANAGHVLYAHKATEGCLHIDRHHAGRTKYAHQQGLTVLHYHYCRPDQGRSDIEMRLFWATVKDTYEDGDILALDFERGDIQHGAVADENYIERCWLKLRELSGHTAVVYGSSAFLEGHVRTRWLRTRRRWQAQYGPKPRSLPWGTPWWAWQMTDGEKGPKPHKLAGCPPGDVSVLNRATATRLSVRASRRRRGREH